MKTIENLKYHNEAVDLLNKQIISKRVSHAYLFCGSCSTLKEELALYFASALNDIDIDDEEILSLDALNFEKYPDIAVYKPEGVNGYLTAQLQSLIQDTKRTPISLKYKINILKDVNKMNTNSANSFLLTLEEPPKYCINLLLCDNKESVLPTIVSRCQVIQLDELGIDDCVQIVQKISGALPAQAKIALDYYHGDIKSSLSFIQNQKLRDLAKYVVEVVDLACGPNSDDWILLEKSEKITQFVKEQVKNYKDTLDLKLSDQAEILEAPAIKDLEKQNKRLVSSFQNELLNLVTNIVTSHLEKMLKNSINHSSFEAQVIRLNSILKLQEKLSYNITPQTYCDILLLKVKHDYNSSD